MKKNLDNFDELVKNKLDELDFSFNETNWEKASQMIEATRPAKKPFVNLLTLSSIVLSGALVIGSVYYFSSGSHVSDLKNSAQNNGTLATSSQPKSISNSENQSLVFVHPALDENHPGTVGNENIENSESRGQQNANAINSDNSASSQIISKPNPFVSYTQETSKKAVENSPDNNDGSVKQEAADNMQFANNAIDKSQSPSANNNALIAIDFKESFHGKKSSDKELIAEQKPSSSKNSPVYAPLGKITKDENENKEITITAANEPTPEEKELTEIPKEQAIKTAIAQPDTASSETARKDYVKLKNHTISLEGGAINSFGWLANGVRNGNSVSPIAGINYIYHFTSKSSLLIGAQYNSISNLTESNVSFSVTSFDFGVNNNVTTYKIVGLEYLTTPIKYIHKLDKNNSIGVGFNLTYLLNIKNKIENYTTIESNVQKTNTTYDTGYGFDKMNRFNGQFALSYSRKVSKQIGFNVELNQSLQNVFKDYSYFGVSNNISKPTALKLSLTYTILNK